MYSELGGAGLSIFLDNLDVPNEMKDVDALVTNLLAFLTLGSDSALSLDLAYTLTPGVSFRLINKPDVDLLGFLKYWIQYWSFTLYLSLLKMARSVHSIPVFVSSEPCIMLVVHPYLWM